MYKMVPECNDQNIEIGFLQSYSFPNEIFQILSLNLAIKGIVWMPGREKGEPLLKMEKNHFVGFNFYKTYQFS